jgi:hypothetical protein
MGDILITPLSPIPEIPVGILPKPVPTILSNVNANQIHPSDQTFHATLMLNNLQVIQHRSFTYCLSTEFKGIAVSPRYVHSTVARKVAYF